MNLFMKALLKSKLKAAGVPQDQMDKLLSAIEQNPDFFKQVAEDAQKKIAGGMGQQEAVMAVLQERQAELQKIVK